MSIADANVAFFWWGILGFLIGWVVEYIFDSVWLRRIERRYQDEIHGLTVEVEQHESANRGMRQEIDGLERQINSEEIRNEKLTRQLEDAERTKHELAESKAQQMRIETDLHRSTIETDNLNTLLIAAKTSASKSDATLTELRSETELKGRSLSISNTRVEVLEDQLKGATAELETARADLEQKNVDLRVLNAHAQEVEQLRRMVAVKDQEIESQRQQLAMRGGGNDEVLAGFDSADSSTAIAATHITSAHLNNNSNNNHNNNNHSAGNVNNHHPLAPLAVETAQKDDFVQIKGIGSKYASALYRDGILTFEALSEQTPEQVNEIINPQFWQVIDPAAWIAEAAVLAQRKRKD